MGLTGEGRWNSVARLEQGRNPNPSLKLVAQFLRICGARWYVLSDLLEAVEVPAIPEDGARRGSQAKTEVVAVRRAQKETRAYAKKTAYPCRGPVLSPDQQRQATQAYLASRLQDNIIRQRVKESLAKLDLPLVHYAIYQMIGDKLLGAIRKAERHRGIGDRGAGIGARTGERKCRGRKPDAERGQGMAAVGESRWVREVFDYAWEQRLDLAVVERIKDTVVRAFVGYGRRVTRSPGSKRQAQADEP